jgi:hypothetical protein
MRRLHSGSLTVKRERQCFAGVTETRQDNDESLEKRGRGGWAKQINRMSGTRKTDTTRRDDTDGLERGAARRCRGRVAERRSDMDGGVNT